MISKLRRIHLIAFALALAVGAIALAVAFKPSAARATAPSRVVKLGDASVSPALHDLATKVAHSAALDPNAIVDVAGVGSNANLAGIFVGSNAASDLVSFHNARGMIGFKPLAPVVASHGGMIVYDQASGTSTETMHVAVEGAVEPQVAKVTIDLANGSTLDAQLVRAGRGGYSFFTYVSDAGTTFPVTVHAYARDGQEVQSRDVREDIQPLCNAANPGCLSSMSSN